MNYYQPLLSDNTYHIFSRAIGSEKLFTCKKDYLGFLRRFHDHINPVASTYAYALLPNHFHFLIKVKPHLVLLDLFKESKRFRGEYDGWQPAFVMQQFSNMLNSYAKSFNFNYARKGALFMDYMRRVEVEDDTQFSSTLFYIHKNPVHHGYCQNLSDWEWSSYNTMLSVAPTGLLRYEVLNWFGNLDKFVEFHKQPVFLKESLE